MIVLIPLGGLGNRFKNLGYSLPKPLINVMGKPIIFWLLDNLNFKDIEFIYIPYNQELQKYNFEERIFKNYPNLKFKFYKLTQNTRGAAETISLSLNQLNIEDQSILCLDGDNFYLTDIIKLWNNKNRLLVFNDNSQEEVYSYVKTNNNTIVEIKEKNKISNLACTGAYGFNSWKQLNIYCKKIINNNIMQKNEFYTSTVIQEMIKDDIQFDISNIDQNNYICLGTPLHVRLFCNNFPRINALNNKKMLKVQRYCFDLDNTLVSYPVIANDYTSVKPIQKNIDFLYYLKRLGHTIIIYTARRMKTHNGNTGKILADIGKITFDTLDKFSIPYDEIYFGKPYADFYIDDLAISSYENLEKELGFYKSEILPREFNSIESTSIQVCKKLSDDLSGEIYYYNNIPNEIKDIFPVMLKFDIKYTWYEMEKINGIPISKLYLDQELTKDQLFHIFGSIIRIQSCKINNGNDINIYCNYSEKLKKRYENYNYAKFDNSEIIYNNIYENLIKYESEDSGKISVIHGDPVFTNILINEFGKIKFIDMRGKQGDKLSIYGDWLYDWAKLYQSLIGYDEILENKFINIQYKNSLLEYFKELFIKKYSEYDFKNLQIITKSLLFSLIPLHDNDKCNEYYNLILKI
jgi:capsule biosynthesis phosphatase